MEFRRIPIAEPDLSGTEGEYLARCVATGWISSRGSFVAEFEEAFASYVNSESAIAVANGTVALHVILAALGIGPGDEVIVPSLTYIATANVVTYAGATPVFVDVDPNSWNMDPEHVESLVSKRTKAVIPVHLYGVAADMKSIGETCERHGLYMIEDAAEAVGTTIGSLHAGTFSLASAFSFFANKTVTTGEGGMVVTSDAELAARVRLLIDQGQSPDEKYKHTAIGFNYRMTNMQAAVGCAQMERVDEFVQRRQEIYSLYRSLLPESEFEFARTYAGTVHGAWMTTTLIRDATRRQRDELISRLAERGVEARPIFFPVHMMDMYKDPSTNALEVTEDVSSRGISLPTFSRMSNDDVAYVAEQVTSALASIR